MLRMRLVRWSGRRLMRKVPLKLFDDELLEVL